MEGYYVSPLSAPENDTKQVVSLERDGRVTLFQITKWVDTHYADKQQIFLLSVSVSNFIPGKSERCQLACNVKPH